MFFPVEKKNSTELAEATTELSLVTPGGFKSKHDDFIDTISMLSSLTPWKPTEEGTLSQDASKGGMWDMEHDDEPVDRMASYIV